MKFAQILMKSMNKNKPSSGKKYHQINQHQPKSPHQYDCSENQRFCIQKQWAIQMMQFHLNDEQPESIMAKRKLEEFSVQLNDQKNVNSFKRNQNSINAHKISINTLKRTTSEGWIDEELTTIQQPKVENPNKQKRIQSASQCSIKQTLKIKTQNEKKKFSFNGQPIQKNNLNLSFNNLSPFHMETINETELSKELVKKVKSHSCRRPGTASYYGASQKIITLFDKESPTKRNNCDTIRIHSNKEMDPKASSLKENRFLKTFSFNSVNKSLSRSKRGSKNLNNNPIKTEANQQCRQKENRLSKDRHSHVRTYSDGLGQNGSKEDINKETYGSYSQRKYEIMNQKRHILSKKIKSHQNISPSHPGERNDEKSRDSLSRESNLMGSSKRVSPSKIEVSYDSVIGKSSKVDKSQQKQKDKKKSPNKHIQTLVQTNIEQDFSTLISMLKNQGQNIFGGQLHNYLTQVKNNSLYNYYYSGGANKKKNGKIILNTTAKMNRTQKGLTSNSEHERMRNLIENHHVAKNNTTLHYTGLSFSKHKDKESAQLLKTTNTSLNQ